MVIRKSDYVYKGILYTLTVFIIEKREGKFEWEEPAV